MKRKPYKKEKGKLILKWEGVKLFLKHIWIQGCCFTMWPS